MRAQHYLRLAAAGLTLLLLLTLLPPIVRAESPEILRELENSEYVTLWEEEAFLEAADLDAEILEIFKESHFFENGERHIPKFVSDEGFFREGNERIVEILKGYIEQWPDGYGIVTFTVSEHEQLLVVNLYTSLFFQPYVLDSVILDLENEALIGNAELAEIYGIGEHWEAMILESLWQNLIRHAATWELSDDDPANAFYGWSLNFWVNRTVADWLNGALENLPDLTLNRSGELVFRWGITFPGAHMSSPQEIPLIPTLLADTDAVNPLYTRLHQQYMTEKYVEEDAEFMVFPLGSLDASQGVFDNKHAAPRSNMKALYGLIRRPRKYNVPIITERGFQGNYFGQIDYYALVPRHKYNTSRLMDTVEEQFLWSMDGQAFSTFAVYGNLSGSPGRDRYALTYSTPGDYREYPVTGIPEQADFKIFDVTDFREGKYNTAARKRHLLRDKNDCYKFKDKETFEEINRTLKEDREAYLDRIGEVEAYKELCVVYEDERMISLSLTRHPGNELRAVDNYVVDKETGARLSDAELLEHWGISPDAVNLEASLIYSFLHNLRNEVDLPWLRHREIGEALEMLYEGDLDLEHLFFVKEDGTLSFSFPADPEGRDHYTFPLIAVSAAYDEKVGRANPFFAAIAAQYTAPGELDGKDLLIIDLGRPDVTQEELPDEFRKVAALIDTGGDSRIGLLSSMFLPANLCMESGDAYRDADRVLLVVPKTWDTVMWAKDDRDRQGNGGVGLGFFLDNGKNRLELMTPEGRTPVDWTADYVLDLTKILPDVEPHSAMGPQNGIRKFHDTFYGR